MIFPTNSFRSVPQRTLRTNPPPASATLARSVSMRASSLARRASSFSAAFQTTAKHVGMNGFLQNTRVFGRSKCFHTLKGNEEINKTIPWQKTSQIWWFWGRFQPWKSCRRKRVYPAWKKLTRFCLCFLMMGSRLHLLMWYDTDTYISQVCQQELRGIQIILTLTSIAGHPRPLVCWHLVQRRVKQTPLLPVRLLESLHTGSLIKSSYQYLTWRSIPAI